MKHPPRLLVSLFAMLSAAAHGYDADYFSYIADSNMHHAMLRQIAKTDALARELAKGKQPAQTNSRPLTTASTVISPAAAPSFPTRLASVYPEKSRPEAERVFRELLVAYNKIEQQFGLQKGDVAGSLAAFIAGNYMAYRNTSFPDENFRPLVRQMQQVLSTNADFQRASTTEKQQLYEQMALVGMLMATGQMALAQQPNPRTASDMRQAAKQYLEQFLKTDAARIEITAKGLVIH